MDSYLIVGLGNPKEIYENTRHNIGFKIIKSLAKKYGLEFKNENKFKAKIAKGNILGFEVYLLMPQTFMNESGYAVKKALDYLKVNIENILVVVDDADIDFEEFRLKKDSSSAGHRGLMSIEKHLNTQSYARLRVGIGRGKKALKRYVLDRFTKTEKTKLNLIIEKAISFIELWLEKGITIAANKANVRLKKYRGKNDTEKKTSL